jgi:TonB-dependent starch-binding outer membrane protein SusC
MKRKRNQLIKRNFKHLMLFLLFFCLAFPFSDNANAQEVRQVTGTVSDGTSEIPLPGVTVLIKGKTTGTVTDIDGHFSISAAPSDILQFSYVGYLTDEITVGDMTEINVTMTEDLIGLQEVVVTGYGVQKKSDITGSIASVSGDRLSEIPVSGIDQALQGRAAGVNIINNSGRPGENASIQIRGITSVNASKPLVIVDGVPGNFEGLNPNDIETVEVLKDASSAAIYGVSGGSGVILITTKKGQSKKLTTSYNYYTGLESATHTIDVMNSQEWMQWVEARYYADNNKSYRDTMFNSRPDTLRTYNWQDIAFQPAWTQSHDISISGGSENSLFLVSSSYYKQEGIVRNSGYRRFTFRVNSEHKLTKRLTYDQKLLFTNTENSGFRANQWTEYYDGPFRRILNMVPTVPDYNPDGTWANDPLAEDNPLALLDMIDRKEKHNNFSANMGMKLMLFKGLSFTSRFAGYMEYVDAKEFQDAYYNTTTDNRPVNKLLERMDNNMGYNAQQLLNYDFTLFQKANIALLAGMEAKCDWGKWIGGERDSLSSSIPSMQYFDLSDNNFAPSQIIAGRGNESRRLAYFGRINADYANKYLITFTLRRDGVYNLAPAKRFGYFPSVSVGWKFSEEAFMRNQSLISFGKFRFGYGEVGNFPTVNGIPYLSIVRKLQVFGYSYDDSDVSSIGAAPVQIENPGLGWETVHMQNYGVDLTLLDNRLSLTAEYYKKVNEDMIMLMSVPYTTGSYSLGTEFEIDNTNPLVNLGSLQNSGFEFTMGYKITKGDLRGSFDLNFSTLKNKVLDLATDSMRRGGVHTVTPINLTRVGGSIAEFWGFQTDGMFGLDDCARDSTGAYIQDSHGKYLIPFYIDNDGDTITAQPNAQPGDAKFIDVDGNGQVLDNEDKVILGSPLPKLIFGFSINLEYKGFDLSAFFNGTLGNKIFNGTKQYLYYYQGTNNHAAEFVNRYVVDDIYKYDPVTGEEKLVVPANHNTTIFRDDASNYTKPTDFYIENGSYLRLRNLVLGYTIPSSLTQKLKIEKLRIYVGARNVFTITKYKGLNPEAGYTTSSSQDSENRQNLDMGIDVGAYPLTRMYLFGVNLQF